MFRRQIKNNHGHFTMCAVVVVVQAMKRKPAAVRERTVVRKAAISLSVHRGVVVVDDEEEAGGGEGAHRGEEGGHLTKCPPGCCDCR